ncbi:MAG: hypothetical protein WKF68_12450 [Daejeonella sp.]
MPFNSDFIHWSAPGAPDADWTLAVEGDYIDDMTVMTKGGIEGQIYIGLPWTFDMTSYATGDFARYGNGRIQPQIAASRDLRHWERPVREAVLPLGTAGAWNDGTLYSSSKMQAGKKQTWPVWKGNR